jgi:hypothetical protein
MGGITRFVPRSERERARLIQEARAIYDRIFPPADPVSETGTGHQQSYGQRRQCSS